MAVIPASDPVTFLAVGLSDFRLTCDGGRAIPEDINDLQILKFIAQFSDQIICGFYIFQDLPNLPLHQHIGKEPLKEIVLPHG